MLCWMILDMIIGKSRGYNTVVISIPGLSSATVVELLVIAPATGYIQPDYALLMISIDGFIVYFFLAGYKHFFRVNDTLNIFSCHGLGAFTGAFLTGLCCGKDVNIIGKNDVFYDNPIQLWYEIVGILFASVYSAYVQ